MNEPEREAASGVCCPVRFWPTALPDCHSQDTGAQRWQLFLRSGLGDTVPVRPRGATVTRRAIKRKDRRSWTARGGRAPNSRPSPGAVQAHGCIHLRALGSRSGFVQVGTQFPLLKLFPIST